VRPALARRGCENRPDALDLVHIPLAHLPERVQESDHIIAPGKAVEHPFAFALGLLRGDLAALHSRTLRSFDEPPFRCILPLPPGVLARPPTSATRRLQRSSTN
jgi:hypothetical protein